MKITPHGRKFEISDESLKTEIVSRSQLEELFRVLLCAMRDHDKFTPRRSEMALLALAKDNGPIVYAIAATVAGRNDRNDWRSPAFK